MWLGRTACERADADLDGHARGALGGAGEVVAEPGDVGGEGGVDGALRRHYILVAVLCRWQAGEPVAGDDALDARWVSLAELDGQALATSFGVADIARKAAALAAAAGIL